MSKTTALLDQAQPFLRDQYATVRKEMGPRLAHTRDLAVPMAMDASHRAWDVSNRVRGEYLPVAMKRTALAAAALRGVELEDRCRERRLRWKLVAAATAVGAALGAGAVLWQRRRNDDIWYEEGDEKPGDAMSSDAAEPEHQHH